MVLDPRHLSRPACFVGTPEGSHDELLFQLVACIAANASETWLMKWREKPTDRSPAGRGGEEGLSHASWAASRTDLCA